MRKVRQRCGFGCVVCGLPLYQYDHILGWAKVRRHLAEEITLLCDKHHREKTVGLLPDKEVRKANSDPYNRRIGVSKPYDLHYEGKECTVKLGSNVFTAEDDGPGTQIVPVSVDGIPLIAVTLVGGHLLLSLRLYDEFNNIVMVVQNNELIYVPAPWDIEFVGRNLIVREASRKILIDMHFLVPNTIEIPRARLLCNGVELLVKPEYMATSNGWAMKDCKTVATPGRCAVGLMIGPHPPGLPAAWCVGPFSRYSRNDAEMKKWVKEVFE
jgi:trigger factor